MKLRLAVLAPLLLASCGIDVPDRVVSGVAVITRYSTAATWGNYLTYSVDPKVVVIDNTGSVSNSCTVDGSQLAPTIKAQMDARNYHEVAFGTPADLEIKMSATLGSQDVYYPGYCGWYYYYYCYPGWTYAGSYEFGSLVIDMGDVKNAVGNKLPIVWNAVNYGILASYYSTGCTPGAGSTVDWPRIQESVRRAFADSPYITRAP